MTGDTRVIPIVKYKEDDIQWVCNASISTETGEPQTLNEKMSIPIGHLWKMSAVSEINNFCRERPGFRLKETQ